jgi:hypothetical protein
MEARDKKNEMFSNSHSEGPAEPRATRFESHALVDVRLQAWNPFSVESAVLLDLSNQGYKMEFVNPIKNIRPGTTLYMFIPLAPFGILAPTRLKLKIIVKWFDAREYRAGGVFIAPTSEQIHILDKVLHFLTQKRAS